MYLQKKNKLFTKIKKKEKKKGKKEKRKKRKKKEKKGKKEKRKKRKDVFFCVKKKNKIQRESKWNCKYQ
jgi:Pin2-interacting protein X1